MRFSSQRLSETDAGRVVDLRGLWRCCKQQGGFEQTCKDRKWISIAKELGITGISNGGHMCRSDFCWHRQVAAVLPMQVWICKCRFASDAASSQCLLDIVKHREVQRLRRRLFQAHTIETENRKRMTEVDGETIEMAYMSLWAHDLGWLSAQLIASENAGSTTRHTCWASSSNSG